MMSNPGVTDPMEYNYTAPMLLFASLGVLALFFAVWLKILNAKEHYGLEEPNIKQSATAEEAADQQADA